MAPQKQFSDNHLACERWRERSSLYLAITKIACVPSTNRPNIIEKGHFVDHAVPYRTDLPEDKSLSYRAVFFGVLTIKKADRNLRGLARRENSCAFKMKPHIKVLFVDHH